MEQSTIIPHLEEYIELINTDRNPHTSAEAHARIPMDVQKRWQTWGLNAEIMAFDHYGFTGRNVFIPPENPLTKELARSRRFIFPNNSSVLSL